MNAGDVLNVTQFIANSWPGIPYRPDVNAEFVKTWLLLLGDADVGDVRADAELCFVGAGHCLPVEA